MASDSADAEEFANHWWWRPGWRVGTRYDAWHLLPGDQPALTGLVGRYQAALAPYPVLGPIPSPWLHLTVQGLGHVEEVSAGQRRAVVDAVRERVGGLVVTGSFRTATIFDEGVVLVPADPSPFGQLYEEIRAGIGLVRGGAAVPDTDHHFLPHLSVAYAQGSGPTGPVREALDRVSPTASIEARFDTLSLIRMHRDRRMYEWEVVDEVGLG